MLPLVCVIFLSLLVVTSKKPLNFSLRFFEGLKFIILTDDAIRKYHIPDKVLAKKSFSFKKELVTYYLHSMVEQLLSGLPFIADFKNMWTIFLTGVGAAAGCVILGLLNIGALKNQLNLFSYGELLVLILLVRIGISASFNRKMHRRFAIGYGVLMSALCFLFLEKVNLGVFEFRNAVLDLIKIQPMLLNVVASICIGFIAYSLSTPMLYELFAYQKLTSVKENIPQFEFAYKIYAEAQKFVRKVSVIAFRSTPFIPLILLFPLKYLTGYNMDTYFTIGFVGFELILAILKLKCIHTNVQILTFDALKSVSIFDSKRSFKSGQNAQAHLQRSLLMIPVSGISLSIHPMLMILMSCSYISSFFMNGITQELTQRISLFMMLSFDFILSGYRLFYIFLSDV